jgi:AAA+ ATPase superfamily predicted ATPase
MKFQLIARVGEEQLFLKCIHELGTIFYTVDSNGVVDEVAYFSGSRIVLFQQPNGLSEQLAQRIKAEGFQVDRLEIDEVQGYVKIVQGSSE